MTAPAAGRIVVDSDALKQATRGPAAVAEQLAQAQAALGQKLDALGACWGNDSAGQSFAQNFVPNQTSALQAVADAVNALQTLSQAITMMAGHYDDADEQTQQTANLVATAATRSSTAPAGTPAAAGGASPATGPTGIPGAHQAYLSAGTLASLGLTGAERTQAGPDAARRTE